MTKSNFQAREMLLEEEAYSGTGRITYCATGIEIEAKGLYKAMIGGVVIFKEPFAGDNFELLDCDIIIIPRGKRRYADSGGWSMSYSMGRIGHPDEWRESPLPVNPEWVKKRAEIIENAKIAGE